MKASDLLAIIQHNDPSVHARVTKIKEKLKQLESYEKCDSCGSRISFEYRRAADKSGSPILVERGTCQGCLGKIPTRAFAIH